MVASALTGSDGHPVILATIEVDDMEGLKDVAKGLRKRLGAGG